MISEAASLSKEYSGTTTQTRNSTSPGSQIEINDLQLVRHSLTAKGIAQEAIEIIMSSWQKFCIEYSIDLVSPYVSDIVGFI